MQVTHLGPYEIEKPLGKGGMGSVYAAVDTQTGQRVAIKALTPQLAVAEGFRERFEAEIESLKTLRHDGIVRLYGYGEQDGVLFYSMELVEGVSLEDELRAGRRFSWREVTNIAIQLSLALKHAHDHGIIHRDIKPANILLHDENQVKLADFGIARLFGATSLTTAGGVLGTADYMSPEQADGRPVTARCDQYSLGGVMYALLAGRPPFRAKNLPQMLQLQRFASPEPVRRYAPETPEQLEHVVMQLLAKDPAERFPNTQVLARHLQAMVMALSRPTTQEVVPADDFALAADRPDLDGPHTDVSEPTALAATQLESEPAPSRDSQTARDSADRSVRPAASQDAPTLAAHELLAKQASPLSPSTALSGSPTTTQPIPGRPPRFTTLEDEEALRRAQQQRSWLVIAGQLGLLLIVLATLGVIAWYLSRPPSPNQLYSSIMAKVEEGDGVSLTRVENELDEFLARYPNDPRAAVIERFKERNELDKLDRKLQRAARGIGASDEPLLPAEQLYLQAVNLADSSPDKALGTLESIVNLYGTDPPADEARPTQDSSKKSDADRDAAARTSDVVQLARRRIGTLRSDLARDRKRQLADLTERLDVAEKLAKTDSVRAAAMYRAIIDLHQGEPWADAVVANARRRLAELKK
jgi:eukaryotic-like serine/threonine-protein kinase